MSVTQKKWKMNKTYENWLDYTLTKMYHWINIQ